MPARTATGADSGALSTWLEVLAKSGPRDGRARSKSGGIKAEVIAKVDTGEAGLDRGEEARQAFKAAAATILAIAGQIREPALRASFLHSHRVSRVLQSAAALDYRTR